jgi:hypothetical protein
MNLALGCLKGGVVSLEAKKRFWLDRNAAGNGVRACSALFCADVAKQREIWGFQLFFTYNPRERGGCVLGSCRQLPGTAVMHCLRLYQVNPAC